MAHPQSIGETLGFNKRSVIPSERAGFEYVVQSPYRRNTRSSNKTAVLHVDMMDLNMTTHDSLSGSFAILEDNGENGTVYHDESTFCKYHWPPISTLSKLRIKLTDVDGNPFDCQNRDNRFEFIMETSNRQRN
jgi:hypothetical protein